MPDRHRGHSSKRKKTVRGVVLGTVLFSGMSCLAPIYASDCSRWVAEYKQGVLQRRAARRLHAAKYRLTVLVHKPAAPKTHPMRHRMGPLESLRRFQIDCGDFDQPTPILTAKAPDVPIEPTPLTLEFPQTPPDLPAPALTEVAEVPPLASTPLLPIDTTSVPGPVPEPSSIVLVLTGAGAMVEVMRRRRLAQEA